ncbi:hypothetical protein PQY04_003094 [Salmonella enterica]|nr:hypothetical protein [Salmonella enterica]ECE0917758.1 hypothetical protein [Salmonella enterica subsp. enterica]ECT9103426.1 hypothetical protein [Salmonella enterica subsp. enterica serovar Urbana]EDQ1016642.1 hypothetical protein [Salmonella enterica subsp. houtenae serovar 50:z4,z23:-]EDS5050523.1 hypothetical protein [Salmonella enterica subsp. enterica serovar Javiana]EDU3036429.1 hypothetical protein [Salmonella enterica subsp. enterica serovar Neudorf]EDV3252232.1 hypothetical prot
MDRPLTLTYDELLAETRQALKLLITTSSTPPDSFDRGCRSGVINFWFQLAWKTSPTEEQRREDYRQLCLLAGLEPPADVH